MTAAGKRTVQDAKQRSWRDFCSTKSSSCPLGRAWNTVRWFRTGSTMSTAVPPLTTNGQPTSTQIDAANVLANQFSFIISWSYPAAPHTEPAPEFSPEELSSALRSLKNTAPGADGISARIIKNLPTNYIQWLLAIYNRCWRDGVMPGAWKTGTVLAFPKPGKDPTKPDSYRPITLLSVLGKLFERLIKRRLEWHLESKGLRYSRQTGFRKGRRSVDNIVYLTNVAKKAMLSNGACLTVFLDIRDAFGSARHHDILDTLLKLGVDSTMYNFLVSYLSDRTARVRVGTAYSAQYDLDCGVPQGAVLSPLLFSILLDDLASSLPHGLELLIYADDLVLFATGNDLGTLNTAVQNGLDVLTQLLHGRGFQLSPSKCHVICFTRKHRLHDYISLQIQGSPVPLASSCRYLGVIFDQRLTWRPYIDFLHTESLRQLSLLRAVVGSSWGADRSSMRLFYIGLIRSRLDYAVVVYRDASQTNLQRLARVQNAALRLILGTPRSTSIAAMEIEAYVPPLDIHRDLMCLRYYAHCRSSPVSHFVGLFADMDASYNPFKATADTICRDWNVSDFFDSLLHRAHASVWPSWNSNPFTLDIGWLPASKSDLASCVSSSLFHSHLSTLRLEHLPLIFTDGSVQKDAQYPGFAFHVPRFNITKQYRASPGASICRVELSALVVAIMWLLGRGIYQAVLCSDSTSALQLLHSVDTVDPLLCALYRTMAQNPGVHYHLLWVPSHVGILGNETVDLAAKSAATNQLAPIFSIPPDQPHTKRILKRAMIGQWQARWSNAEGGRFLYSIQPTILRTVLFGFSFPRWLERLLALSRVDRFPTRSTLHRFNLSTSSQCPTCLVADTLEHRYTTCPVVNAQRRDFYESLDHFQVPHSSRTLSCLLNFEELPSSTVRPVLTAFGHFLSCQQRFC